MDITIRSLRPHRMTLDRGEERYRGGQITSLGAPAAIKMLVEANIVRTLLCDLSAIPSDAQSLGCPVYCNLVNYAPVVLADTPLGYWRLDETSGTSAADSSGNGRTGTYTGGFTLNQTGALVDGNAALLLNGSSGYVTMGDIAAFEFTGAFSVEAWVKFTSTSNFIVSKSLNTAAGWFLGVTASGNVQFFAATAAIATVFNVQSGSAFNNGLYHHVVATWDGTTNANGVKLYIDGVLNAQGTAGAGTIAQNAAPFLIGAWHTTPASFFGGTVDEVAVYGAELSAARVAAHNTAGLTSYAIGTVVGSSFADPPRGGDNAASVARGEFRPGIIPRSVTGEPETWWEG